MINVTPIYVCGGRHADTAHNSRDHTSHAVDDFVALLRHTTSQFGWQFGSAVVLVHRTMERDAFHNWEPFNAR